MDSGQAEVEGVEKVEGVEEELPGLLKTRLLGSRFCLRFPGDALSTSLTLSTSSTSFQLSRTCSVQTTVRVLPAVVPQVTVSV